MADNKGRREEAVVFFVYDHNMLRKEEDDLKDAILYFSPEDVSADDQCALCGQLMGISEFLDSTLSKSAPQMYRFEHMKFAISRFGAYTLALQGRPSVPDALLRDQLRRLYNTFVTFHGSIDSLRLRFKESHTGFLQELALVWRNILAVSGVGGPASLDSVFGTVPYIHLPKSGAHLFLQASHLLQSSQRRPYVMAGAILYKNGVLCSQLSPELTKQLTFLQNQMPHISRTTEFDLPVGCRIITLLLTDKEMQEINPLDYQTKRHCKGSDFRMQRKHDRPNADSPAVRKVKRRLTCPDLGSTRSNGRDYISGKALNNFIRNEQKKPYQLKQGAMGIDQMPGWKPRKDGLLSHVPIVECRSGESPIELESEVLGDIAKESHFGECYTEVKGQTVVKDTAEAPESDENDDIGLEAKSQQIEVSTVRNEIAEVNSLISSNKTDYIVDSDKGKTDGLEGSDRNGNIDAFDRGLQRKHNVTEASYDETLEPTISDLENSESDTSMGTCKKDNERELLCSRPSQGDDIITIDDNDMKNNCKFDPRLDTSVEIIERGNLDLSNSDDRTKTVSKDSHHTVVSHRADIHVEGAGKHDCRVNDTNDINESQSVKHDYIDKNERHSVSENVSAEIVRGEIEHSLDEFDKRFSSKSQSNTDHEQKTGLDPEKTGLNEAENNHRVPQITMNMKNSDADVSSIPESDSHLKTRTNNDTEKENQDPNYVIEVTTDNIEESEVETEDENMNIENDNPCINCLEAATGKGSGDKDIINIRCEQCQEKHAASKVYGKCEETQEVIDFQEKSRDKDSEKIKDGSLVQENLDVRGSYEGFITSSFSSDVSTDSTISRYWTQEMDGLTDITLYVQCHSDISLFLIMENPENYQENVFHALWKGSLAQLADLDYYIKECLDSQEEETLLDTISFARYDNTTHSLTGSMVNGNEGGNESLHLNQMLANLHAEFEVHTCLSDVCLRSQINGCYGHQSSVDETFFQTEGPNKLTSGLPLPKDPLFTLENTARSRLAKDRKLSMI